MTIIPVLLSTTLYNISSILDQGIFKNIVTLQGYDAKLIGEWWGVYTGQYKVLINVPISIASALAASSVPTLSAAFQRQDKRQIRSQIHSATRFIMIIAFPCTIGMGVLGGPIMMFLFSDGDPTSAKMMTYGAIAILFYSLSTLSNGLLQGINKLKIPVQNAAIALVLQAIFLIVALEVFDLNIFAMVYANAFYAFCMCVLNHIAVVRYSGVHQNVTSTYILPLLSSAIMGVAVYVFYQAIHFVTHSNSFACVVAIMLGAVVYFVVMLLVKGISRKDLLRIPKGEYLVLVAEKMHLISKGK